MKKKISIFLLTTFAVIQLGYAANYRTPCGVEVDTISRVTAYLDGWSMEDFDAYLSELDAIYCP